MIKNIFIALTIIITGASIFFFNSIYKEAKNYQIKQLNEEQAIYARQSNHQAAKRAAIKVLPTALPDLATTT